MAEYIISPAKHPAKEHLDNIEERLTNIGNIVSLIRHTVPSVIPTLLEIAEGHVDFIRNDLRELQAIQDFEEVQS